MNEVIMNFLKFILKSTPSRLRTEVPRTLRHTACSLRLQMHSSSFTPLSAPPKTVLFRPSSHICMRTFADKNIPADADKSEKTAATGKQRLDKLVNEGLRATFESEENDKNSASVKRKQKGKSSENIDASPRPPVIPDDASAVQGRPDPKRMRNMLHPEEASSDSGGYIKLEDIGFDDKFVDKKMAEEQEADDRIRKFDPNDTRRRDELPYGLLKTVTEAGKDMSEKKGEKGGRSDKRDAEKTKEDENRSDHGDGGKDNKHTKMTKSICDEDVKNEEKTHARSEEKGERNADQKNRRRKDDGDDCDDEKRKPNRNRDSDEGCDDRQKDKAGKDVAQERKREREEDGKKNERRTERRSQASVLWENSRAQASPDSSGMGQLTEQLMDRDQADKRAEKTDLSEGEKWKQGARQEGVQVEDTPDTKKKPRK